MMRRLTLRKPFAAALGGALLAVPLGFAVLAIWWTPYGITQMDFVNLLAPPSAQHWLGTDEFGRDVLSRLMAGASLSMMIAFETMLATAAVGALLGGIAGYFRGIFERALNLVANALLSFPGIMLALGVTMVAGQSPGGIVLALSFAYAPSVYRIVRASALSVRSREYVEASYLMGNSSLYTLFRHVLPNCLSPLIVIATSIFGWSILAESALSFLGMGVPPPAPSWGNMLADARQFMDTDALLSIVPGLCIAGVLLGVNLLGDALRDRFDPRMEGHS